tara:strand:- start:6854 stop:7018 length:165 start_codon:yes stop_codon:yes gene_type:complete
MIWYSESTLQEEYKKWIDEQRKIEKKHGIVLVEKDIEYFRREVWEPMLNEVYDG